MPCLRVMPNPGHTKKYHQKFDDIKLRVPKGERELLQAHAESQGESLNAFLRRAAKETIARDREEGSTDK